MEVETRCPDAIPEAIFLGDHLLSHGVLQMIRLPNKYLPPERTVIYIGVEPGFAH
ncbi:hypothetical protein [Rhizobium sp. 42MFCr.1]|uniref:hypothetical protein n=1 Tax=Rhizobium sp. 42MFCr.1 TaxID=1048680 RepID=UPI000377E8CC|nr:hypothetical protein [Rhizobium sp. 42MFCr.1]